VKSIPFWIINALFVFTVLGFPPLAFAANAVREDGSLKSMLDYL